MSDLSLRSPWDNLSPTRLIKLNSRLYAKFEVENPTGSIKDRPIQFIIKQALLSGAIDSNTVLVEASSGNTGISLCAVGASLGLPVKIIMPCNMSKERKDMMKAFGAEVLDAPPSDFKSAIEMRNNLVMSRVNYWSPMQFENPQNILCHKETTAREIFSQVPEGASIDAFFSGAGTGGTIMGFREACIERGTSTKCMLVVPAEESSLHGIQGIGDGGDYLVNRDLMDGIHSVTTAGSIARAKKFAMTRGVLIGISAGANLLAAERYIKDTDPAGVVVTVICDRGERYLSNA